MLLRFAFQVQNRSEVASAGLEVERHDPEVVEVVEDRVAAVVVVVAVVLVVVPVVVATSQTATAAGIRGPWRGLLALLSSKPHPRGA